MQLKEAAMKSKKNLCRHKIFSIIRLSTHSQKSLKRNAEEINRITNN